MIRDPSDGAVKENPVAGMPTTETSGLPITKERAEELARLEKSREWLANYKAWLMEKLPGQVL